MLLGFGFLCFFFFPHHIRRSGHVTARNISALPKFSKYILNIKHLLIYNGHRAQPGTGLLYPWDESAPWCQPSHAPLCTVIVFPALVSICQPVPSATTTCSRVGGSWAQPGCSRRQQSAGTPGWTWALPKIFCQPVNLQGTEPCPEKAGHHLSISAHSREEQTLDFLNFFFLNFLFILNFLFFFPFSFLSYHDSEHCIPSNTCKKRSSLWQGKRWKIIHKNWRADKVIKTWNICCV